ncbi:MAG: hypothetical protein AB1758_28265 [Candidatus Eremiobacterota bacterium]
MLLPGTAVPMYSQVQTTASETLKQGAKEAEKGLREALQAPPRQARPLDEQGQALLAHLPAEMQEQYRALDPRARDFMASKLTGSSGFLFLRINHRKAFIKGQALGHDVFDFIAGRVRDKVRKGELTPSQGERTLQFLAVVKTLTPSQRTTLVQLLEHHTGIRK